MKSIFNLLEYNLMHFYYYSKEVLIVHILTYHSIISVLSILYENIALSLYIVVLHFYNRHTAIRRRCKSSRSPAHSFYRVIKVLMKTSMNIYSFVPSKFQFVSTPPVVWRCSFLLRRDIKRGLIDEVLSAFNPTF